jgi:hypothetical protein
MSGHEARRRDRLAWAICTWVLRHVATSEYAQFITGINRYGIAAAARDASEDRPAPEWPPPWFSSIEAKRSDAAGKPS